MVVIAVVIIVEYPRLALWRVTKEDLGYDSGDINPAPNAPLTVKSNSVRSVGGFVRGQH